MYAFLTNSVFLGVLVLLLLALLRMNVVIALVMGSLVAGVAGHLSLTDTLAIFNQGLGSGANIALNYALLGAFAGAVSYSGIPEFLVQKVTMHLSGPQRRGFVRRMRWTLIGLFLFLSIICKNLLPVHIAFIPILIPPLLGLMAQVQLDRRLVACVLTFGLVASYMTIPLGFGYIFLRDIMQQNLRINGLDVSVGMIIRALLIPLGGMALGLLLAVFYAYARPRRYDRRKIRQVEARGHAAISQKHLLVSALAIVSCFAVQILTRNNMIAGTLCGLMIFWLGGIIHWTKVDDVITSGFKMMTLIGMIMIAAAGFTAVIRASGGIEELVSIMIAAVHGSRALAALLMLLIGLLITMGIGSAFATVPIVAVLYLPLCHHLGFSPMASIALVGVASVLGDPGSPASDSTLGPSSGLGIDGQYNHIRDCVIPTFIYYNVPLLIFGWIAAMVL